MYRILAHVMVTFMKGLLNLHKDSNLTAIHDLIPILISMMQNVITSPIAGCINNISKPLIDVIIIRHQKLTETLAELLRLERIYTAHSMHAVTSFSSCIY